VLLLLGGDEFFDIISNKVYCLGAKIYFDRTGICLGQSKLQSAFHFEISYACCMVQEERLGDLAYLLTFSLASLILLRRSEAILRVVFKSM